MIHLQLLDYRYTFSNNHWTPNTFLQCCKCSRFINHATRDAPRPPPPVDSWDADVAAFVRVAFVLLLIPEEARDHVDAPMLFEREPSDPVAP